MSSKIYGGLRSTIRDPFELGLKVREIIEPIFMRKVDEAVTLLDANPETNLDNFFYPLGGKPVDRGFDNADTVINAVEKLRKSVRRTFSDYDFGYEVILIPNRYSAEKPLLMIFSEASDEYTQALLDADVVEEYGYWDNTDRPEEVTAKEWKQRKKAWGALLESFTSPAEIGLSIANPGGMAFDMWKIKKRDDARSSEIS